MEKEFIPYEQSLKLKELGFDEPCFGYWNIDPSLPTKYLNPRCEPFKHDWCLPAPTFSQAFRWFREKYGLKSWIQEHTAHTFIYEIRPHKLTNYREGEVYVYEVYEEAELACLNKLIEIVSKEKTVLIDPPSGWKYGFPKEYKFKGELPNHDVLCKWLVDNGYPQAEIDLLGDYFHIQISGDL